MTKPVLSHQYGDYIIKIWQDESLGCPRDEGIYHSRIVTINNGTDFDERIVCKKENVLEDFADYLKKRYGCGLDGVVWLPVYKRNGIVEEFATEPFGNSRTSGGHVGFIYETSEDLCEEFKVEELDPSLRLTVENRLALEIEDLDTWCKEGWFYYTVASDKTAELVTSGDGYLGLEDGGRTILKDAVSMLELTLSRLEKAS